MKVIIRELKPGDLEKAIDKLPFDIVISCEPGDKELKFEPVNSRTKELLVNFIKNYSFPPIPTPDENPWEWLHYFAGRITSNMRYISGAERTPEDKKTEKELFRRLFHPTEEEKKEIQDRVNKFLGKPSRNSKREGEQEDDGDFF